MARFDMNQLKQVRSPLHGTAEKPIQILDLGVGMLYTLWTR